MPVTFSFLLLIQRASSPHNEATAWVVPPKARTGTAIRLGPTCSLFYGTTDAVLLGNLTSKGKEANQTNCHRKLHSRLLKWPPCFHPLLYALIFSFSFLSQFFFFNLSYSLLYFRRTVYTQGKTHVYTQVQRYSHWQKMERNPPKCFQKSHLNNFYLLFMYFKIFPIRNMYYSFILKNQFKK